MRKLYTGLRKFITVFFFCLHDNTTWPRKDKRGRYILCNDCGKRFRWDWKEKSYRIKPPRRLIEGKSVDEVVADDERKELERIATLDGVKYD